MSEPFERFDALKLSFLRSIPYIDDRCWEINAANLRVNAYISSKYIPRCKKKEEFFFFHFDSCLQSLRPIFLAPSELAFTLECVIFSFLVKLRLFACLFVELFIHSKRCSFNSFWSWHCTFHILLHVSWLVTICISLNFSFNWVTLDVKNDSSIFLHWLDWILSRTLLLISRTMGEKSFTISRPWFLSGISH